MAPEDKFGEKGIWDHGLGLYPKLTHVPLLILEIDCGETCEETVSLIHVHWTILRIAGVKDENYEGRGRDLQPLADHEPQLTEYLGLNMWRERKLEAAGKADEFSTYAPGAVRHHYSRELLWVPEIRREFRRFWDDVPRSPPRPMDELVDDLNYFQNADDIDVLGSVIVRLEDLGYA